MVNAACTDLPNLSPRSLFDKHHDAKDNCSLNMNGHKTRTTILTSSHKLKQWRTHSYNQGVVLVSPCSAEVSAIGAVKAMTPSGVVHKR